MRALLITTLALALAACGASYPDAPAETTTGTSGSTGSVPLQESTTGSGSTSSGSTSSGSTSSGSTSSGSSSGGDSGSTGGYVAGCTWSSWAQSFFADNCAHCHGSEFASASAVATQAPVIRSLIDSGSMPRSGSLSAEDRAEILAWFDCGMPQ